EGATPLVNDDLAAFGGEAEDGIDHALCQRVGKGDDEGVVLRERLVVHVVVEQDFKGDVVHYEERGIGEGGFIDVVAYGRVAEPCCSRRGEQSHASWCRFSRFERGAVGLQDVLGKLCDDAV